MKSGKKEFLGGLGFDYMATRIKTLEEISERYGFILVDNSSLCWTSLGNIETSLLDFEGRISLSEEGKKSTIFFKKFLEEGKNFYVTPSILKEYDTYYPYNKIIKNRKNTSKKCLEMYRKRREESKERRKLIRVLKENYGILEFDGNEKKLYDEMSRKYSFLKRKKNISEADFDFLISGAVVSMKRNLTSLISNDFGIFYSWRELLKKEKLTPKQLGFFVRKEFNVFKRGKLYGSYKI
ncbi:MAG: hypothetical protein IIA85_02055 [Nanoarchaeota archaeon]|nr:hypothetical protein [Nanoarchaeota archaeon]